MASPRTQSPASEPLPYWDREPEVLTRAETVRELDAACREIHRLREELSESRARAVQDDLRKMADAMVQHGPSALSTRKAVNRGVTVRILANEYERLIDENDRLQSALTAARAEREGAIWNAVVAGYMQADDAPYEQGRIAAEAYANEYIAARRSLEGQRDA